MKEYMYLDGIDIGVGKFVIGNSKFVDKFGEVETNVVDIYSLDNNYRLTFWTKIKHQDFSKLKLNIKTDIMDLIDDYDIDFGTREYTTINSRENTMVYLTRVDNDKYVLNIEIDDFSDAHLCSTNKIKNLKLQAVIKFYDL